MEEIDGDALAQQCVRGDDDLLSFFCKQFHIFLFQVVSPLIGSVG